MKRCVITAIGMVTSLGQDTETTWQSIKDEKLGISLLSDKLREDSGVHVAATIHDFDGAPVISKKDTRRMDRFTQIGLVAADEAWKASGIDSEAEDADRMAVIVASGIGGLTSIVDQVHVLDEKGAGRVSPFFIPKTLIDLLPGQIAIKIGAKGACYSIVTACATGTDTIGNGYREITSGRCDVVLAGGSESVMTPLSLAGFNQMGALSKSDDPKMASLPFDARRGGFVMGEGAAMLVLEELEHAKARGANIIAELIGYAQSCDAYHITQPHPDGEGARNVMKRAMADAKIDSKDIDLINAHGTATPYNDAMESRAIVDLFGDHAKDIAVTSTKSMTGHLLGAAGAVEAAITALSLKEDFVPATIGLEEPDPECPVNASAHGRKMEIHNAISNSFGFGGHNSSIVMSKYTED